MKTSSLLAFILVIFGTVGQQNRSFVKSESDIDNRVRAAATTNKGTEVRSEVRIPQEDFRIRLVRNENTRRSFRVKNEAQIPENSAMMRIKLTRSGWSSREETRSSSHENNNLVRQDRSDNRRIFREEPLRRITLTRENRIREETRRTSSEPASSQRRFRTDNREFVRTNIRAETKNLNQENTIPATRTIYPEKIENNIRFQSGTRRLVRESRLNSETRKISPESSRVRGETRQTSTDRVTSEPRRIVREELSETRRLVREAPNRADNRRKIRESVRAREETPRLVRENQVRADTRVNSGESSRVRKELRRHVSEDRVRSETQRNLGQGLPNRLTETVREQNGAERFVREDQVHRETRRVSADTNRIQGETGRLTRNVEKRVETGRISSDRSRDSRRTILENRRNLVTRISSDRAESRRMAHEDQTRSEARVLVVESQVRDRIVPEKNEVFSRIRDTTRRVDPLQIRDESLRRVVREERIRDEKTRTSSRLGELGNRRFVTISEVRDQIREITKNIQSTVQPDQNTISRAHYEDVRDTPTSRTTNFELDNFGKYEDSTFGWNQFTSAVFGGAALFLLHFQRNNVKLSID